MSIRASNNSIRKRLKREREELDSFIAEVVTEFLDDLSRSQYLEWAEYAEIYHQYRKWYHSRALHWNHNKKKDTVKADVEYFDKTYKPLEKPFKHGNRFEFYGAFREAFGLD